MSKTKEEIYNKINPILNELVGRLTMLSDTAQGKKAHEMALEIANLLDDWINEENE